jgi:hypothetical protein
MNKNLPFRGLDDNFLKHLKDESHNLNYVLDYEHKKCQEAHSFTQ